MMDIKIAQQEAITELVLENQRLKRDRDEAREALREIWQSGDAFLPHVDSETINRWRKAAGWEGTK
jgi:quinol monooxygenase YgiN